MDRPRIATVWLGGCSGCHMSLLDLDEFLLDLARQAQLVFSPLMDIKQYPDQVDICLVEGAVCNEDHLEMAHTLRRRTRTVIAFGDCAVTGNVTAIRNQLGSANREEVLQCAYHDAAETNPKTPAEPGIVPKLLERVVPLQEVIYVDHYLTGCPPPAARIKNLITSLLAGQPPQLSGPDIKFG